MRFKRLIMLWSMITIFVIQFVSSLEASGSVVSSATVNDLHNPLVTINIPENNRTYSSSIFIFNVTLNEPGGSVLYSLNGGINNVSMNATTGSNLKEWTHANSSVPDGSYNFTVYANDTSGNKNYTESASFIVSIAIVGGGGAGGTGINPKIINLTLCNYTYEYINTYSQTDYSLIDLQIDKIKEEINLTFNWVEFRRYLDNWQSYCSDNINRSLKQELVCSKAKEFKEFRNDSVQILNVTKSLKDKIVISVNLFNYYIDNYDNLCGGFRPFSVISLEKVKQNYFIFILILILLVLLILTLQNKKKVLLFLALKKRRSQNLKRRTTKE